MHNLYHREDAEILRRRVRVTGVLAGIAAAAGIAVGIVCAVSARTATVDRMELTAVAAGALTGAFAVLLLSLVVNPALHEIRHIEGIEAGEQHSITAVLKFSGEPFTIPSGVLICRADAVSAEERERVSINYRFRRLIPEGKLLRLCVVNGFVTAFEEVEA